MVQEANNNTNIRGKLSGIWMWGHPANTCTQKQQFTGTRDLQGKTLMTLNPMNNGGVVAIEITDTWDTN